MDWIYLYSFYSVGLVVGGVMIGVGITMIIQGIKENKKGGRGDE